MCIWLLLEVGKNLLGLVFEFSMYTKTLRNPLEETSCLLFSHKKVEVRRLRRARLSWKFLVHLLLFWYLSLRQALPPVLLLSKVVMLRLFCLITALKNRDKGCSVLLTKQFCWVSFTRLIMLLFLFCKGFLNTVFQSITIIPRPVLFLVLYQTLMGLIYKDFWNFACINILH